MRELLLDIFVVRNMDMLLQYEESEHVGAAGIAMWKCVELRKSKHSACTAGEIPM